MTILNLAEQSNSNFRTVALSDFDNHDGWIDLPASTNNPADLIDDGMPHQLTFMAFSPDWSYFNAINIF